jgi:hypothetical protein
LLSLKAKKKLCLFVVVVVDDVAVDHGLDLYSLKRICCYYYYYYYLRMASLLLLLYYVELCLFRCKLEKRETNFYG